MTQEEEQDSNSPFQYRMSHLTFRPDYRQKTYPSQQIFIFRYNLQHMPSYSIEAMAAAAKWSGCNLKGEATFHYSKIGKTNSSMPLRIAQGPRGRPRTLLEKSLTGWFAVQSGPLCTS